MSNMITEALLLLVEEKKKQRDMRHEEHRKEINDMSVEISKIIHEAQENCVHPTTREEHDFNGHTREQWVETYCVVCGKRLSRV